MPPHDKPSALSRRRLFVAGAACAGTLAVPSAVSAQAAAAETTYSLTVTNRSTQAQQFCLYQSPVDLGVPGATSLAWLTARAKPNRTRTFTWTVDYSYVWALTGPLTSGIQFATEEEVAADPNDLSENETTFGFSDGFYRFGPGTPGSNPQLGTLAIDVLLSVPDDTASVGLAMSGSPVFAVQATPSGRGAPGMAFRLQPDYWITTGPFIRGEVLNVTELVSAAEIPYDDTFSMDATLEPSGLWTVRTPSA